MTVKELFRSTKWKKTFIVILFILIMMVVFGFAPFFIVTLPRIKFNQFGILVTSVVVIMLVIVAWMMTVRRILKKKQSDRSLYVSTNKRPNRSLDASIFISLIILYLFGLFVVGGDFRVLIPIPIILVILTLVKRQEYKWAEQRKKSQPPNQEQNQPNQQQ